MADPAQQKLILCVEDEADLRTDIVEELQAAGYATVEAADGHEALAAIVARPPDLVLCDITMPGGLSGFDVLREVRARHPGLADVPFLFLTALADRTDVIAGKRAGADDYLVKPIDYDVLLATVSARLGQVTRIRAKAAAEDEQARATFLDLFQRRARDAFESASEAWNRIALGVFLLGPDNRIVFSNRVGSELLDEADGLMGVRGEMRGGTPDQTRALRQLIDTARDAAAGSGPCGEGAMSLPRPSGRRSLAVLVCPLGGTTSGDALGRPEVVVFVTDPERRPQLPADILAKLYGLTPAETRLALLLAGGKRLEEAAEELGISTTTARWTLKNLFRKTETDRQADLVRLLLSSPVSVDPQPR